MSMIPPGGVVIYDGDCGICTHTVRILKKLDAARRLEFLANNQPQTFERFPELDLDRSRQEILVMDPRTGWFGGYEACEWIACRIPWLWIFIPITFIPGFKILGDKLYKITARNRAKISKALGLKACKI